MIPENRIPTHPGVILSQQFLASLGMSQVAFAAHLDVPVQRISELIRGKRGVTPDTAWLLSQALNTTPEFWLNLQTAHDLARCWQGREVEIVSDHDMATEGGRFMSGKSFTPCGS